MVTHNRLERIEHGGFNMGQEGQELMQGILRPTGKEQGHGEPQHPRQPQEGGHIQPFEAIFLLRQRPDANAHLSGTGLLRQAEGLPSGTEDLATRTQSGARQGIIRNMLGHRAWHLTA